MGGGSKTTSNQQSTSSNTIDPQSLALLQNNYAGAQDRANSLTPYTGQLTAGFTPAQTQAQGILSAVGTDPSYQANANSAISGAQGVLSSDPLTGDSLQKYENPYTNDVINASINDNERARQMATVNDNQRATASGAFGGSRSGVANSLTNDAYDRNNQSNIAALNAGNFGQAQTAALNSSNLKLSAANNVANLNNNALNTAATQGGILGAVGDQQQQQQQTELSNAYNAYMQGQQLTLEQQNLLNAALGMIPIQQTLNSSGSGTQTTKNDLSLGGVLGGVGSLMGGLGAAGLVI